MSNFYPPTAVRIAQTLGISTSFLLSGSLISFSYATIPALLQPAGLRPSASTLPSNEVSKQWLALFTHGRKLGRPLSYFALANFAYVARAYYYYSEAGHTTAGGLWSAYSFAALLVYMVNPYTKVFLRKVNESLTEFAKRPVTATGEAVLGKEEEDEAQLRELLDKWTQFNYGRAVFPLLSGLIGLWASLA